MALELGDELGLPWDDWADGQAHVLKRGRDFFRNVDVVHEAARNAARRLDKVVSVVKEHRVGKTYIWVQFSDYEAERGAPCPGCGGDDTLRLLNPQSALCVACGATIVLPRPKRQKRVGDSEAPGADPAGELIAALLAPSPGAARAPARLQPEDAGQRARSAGGISRVELRDLIQRTKQAVPAEEARRWGRRGFSEVATIVAAGAFARDRTPIQSFDVADDVEVYVLLELAEKQVDVRVGVVFSDDGAARYRVILADLARIPRPGRYTFSVLLPGGTLAPGAYGARVSGAFVKDDEFSRVTRREAFSLQATTAGEPAPLPDETVLLDDLQWRIEPGDGPWSLGDSGGDAGA